MSDLVICKTVGVVTKGSDDAESDSGTFEVILSTPAQDRDGEEVKAEEWEAPLPDHITFDIDHGMSVATTVGSGVPELGDDGKMRVKGRWASTDLAQQTRALVNEGHIKTTSVAFLRKTGSKAPGGKVVTRELLNGAFVAVPANVEAVVLNSKSLQSELKAGARNSSDDSTRLQSIHDMAVENGAACAAAGDKAAGVAQAKALVSAALKSLAGSYEERERAVYEAISGTYSDRDNDIYAWPVATFDDSVVFRVSGGDESGTTWRTPYTMADDGTASLGDREQVVITEVVTTVSEGSSSAADAADSAAKAAESAAEDAETRALDVDETAAKALAVDNLRAALNLGR